MAGFCTRCGRPLPESGICPCTQQPQQPQYQQPQAPKEPSAFGLAIKGLPQLWLSYCKDPIGTTRKAVEKHDFLSGILMAAVTYIAVFFATLVYALRLDSHFPAVAWLGASLLMPVAGFGLTLLAVSIGAILNKHQKGELYFGVRPDGTPIGQEISEKTLRDISQAISNHIEPQIFPEIQTVRIDGKECILVRFEGYNTPYFAYDVARIRVADEDKVLSQQELVAYLRKQDGAEDAWERRVSNFLVEQVDGKLVERYIERGHEAKRIEFEYADKTSALNKLLLTEGEHLLNAGMVLFCESMYAELQMAIFAGTERLTFLDIQRHRGTVFELVALAEKYIMSNIHWRVHFDGSLQRKEIPEIPADAIREALINSFCHKDYGACQSNEVAIYKDRVEIYNPGSFPEGYRPEDFISGDERPVRRNPLITSILYYSKDVESFGTGLKRIADACNEANCRFAFKIMKSGFVVVFFRSESHDAQDNAQVGAQDAAQVGIRDKILACCQEPRSRTEIAAYCGYKSVRSLMQSHLKPLLESGQLRMTIPDKPNSRNQKYVAVKPEE